MNLLITSIIFSSLTILMQTAHAENYDKRCKVKDISDNGALLLRAASRLGNIDLVRFLVIEKCVDINGKMKSNPESAPAAFLATNAEVFNFYAQNGFNYTRSKNRMNFLIKSLERSKEKGGTKEEGDVLEANAAKYSIPSSMLFVPAKAVDETDLQIKFVSSVPRHGLLMRDENRNNLLHHSVSMGRGDLADIILAREPNALHQRNINGLTPLMISADGCKSDSLKKFYKVVRKRDWLRRFKIKDFDFISLSPIQVHLLSNRSDITSYIELEPEIIAAETNGLKEIMQRAPSNFRDILLQNINISNICKQDIEN